MRRNNHASRFSTRLLVLARDTFEATVAIHYDAPWARTPVSAKSRSDIRAA